MLTFKEHQDLHLTEVEKSYLTDQELNEIFPIGGVIAHYPAAYAVTTTVATAAGYLPIAGGIILAGYAGIQLYKLYSSISTHYNDKKIKAARIQQDDKRNKMLFDLRVKEAEARIAAVKKASSKIVKPDVQKQKQKAKEEIHKQQISIKNIVKQYKINK